MSAFCLYCSNPGTQLVAGLPVCSVCRDVFWNMSERVCAPDGEFRCEACGREAGHLVDAIWLCRGCYRSIHRALKEDVLILSMGRTQDEIRQLPEVPSAD
jgi:ribosomal protein S14